MLRFTPWLRFASVLRLAPTLLAPCLLACTAGDDDGAPPPPPPERSVFETCIAGGGHLAELWHENNAHGAVQSITVSGDTVVLGSIDGSVKQWNLVPGGAATATYGTVFTEEGPAVSALAVSGDRLVGADQSGHLAQWKLSTAAPMGAVAVGEQPLTVAAAGSTQTAVAVGPQSPEIRVIDGDGHVGAPLTTLLWGTHALAYSHDALFTAGHFYNTPFVERRAADAPATATSQWGDQSTNAHITAIAVDPAGTTLVAAGDQFVSVFPAADLTPGPTVTTPAPSHAPVGIVLFSGNELFATAGSEGTLQLWSATTGANLSSLPIAPPSGLATNGTYLFTSGPDGLLHTFACR